MAAAARAGALLTTLRKEREALKADDRDAVQLVGSDGIVCVQRLLACSMSPVLRAAFTGPYSESAGSYSLTEHSSATILFAVEHLLGSDSCITNSNSFELLALSDQLDLVPLKAACEAALLSILVTSNAQTLQDAAVRFGCAELREAAEEIQNEETSSLGELMARKQGLLAKRADAQMKQEAARAAVNDIDCKLAEVADKHAHELEQAFRAKAATSVDSSGEQDNYPLAATSVVRVLPNANNPYSWMWDTDYDEPKKKSSTASTSTGSKKKAGTFDTPDSVQPKKKARVAGDEDAS